MASRRAKSADLAAAQAAAARAISRGDAAGAIGPLRHIAATLPRNAGALHNLGLALSRTGQTGEAAHWFSRAVRIDPGNRESLRLLSRQLQLIPEFHPDTVELAGLAPGLTAKTLNRQPFVRAVLDVLKRSAPLDRLIDVGRSGSWENAANMLLAGEGRSLLGNQAFLDALAHGVNVDFEIELLLTAARRRLLTGGNDILAQRRVYVFACALARQCWNNEYVFAVDDDEGPALAAATQRASALVPDAVSGTAPLAVAVLAYAPATELWPAQPPEAFAKVQPRALREVIVDQLTQARDEAAFGAAITGFGELSDPVSRAVAVQYEANPYPRWLSTDLPEPASARNQLRRFFDDAELSVLERPCRVLVAGCGTGQQTVDLATQFGPDADVTAVDLSRASLGYAALMAKRYGIANVRFLRGDILDLASLDDSFAVIVCDGVLHHMADPLAGWRNLADRLAPGGLMRISLYSKLARQLLARDRGRLDAADDIVTEPDRLRALRRTLMAGNLADADTPNYRLHDYFTLSAFRDLIFHVQEHQFTLPEIASALNGLGLTFHGFRLPWPVLAAFRQHFADEAALRDLEAWHRFEQAEPATFINMYTFWCRASA